MASETSVLWRDGQLLGWLTVPVLWGLHSLTAEGQGQAADDPDREFGFWFSVFFLPSSLLLPGRGALEL